MNLRGLIAKLYLEGIKSEVSQQSFNSQISQDSGSNKQINIIFFTGATLGTKAK